MDDNYEDKLIKELMDLWQQTESIYTQLLKRWNLSMNAYYVLKILRETPDGEEPAKLANQLNVQRQLITLILNNLDDRGYIIRKEQRTDHRKKHIILTDSGRIFAVEVCETVNRLDRYGMSVFTREEMMMMQDFSQRHIHAIKFFSEKILCSTQDK